MLINARIKRVVFTGEYPDTMAVDMFGEAGVELVHMGFCDDVKSSISARSV
jgi:deoxycytidylate deaminase